MTIKRILFMLLVTAPLFAQKNISAPVTNLTNAYKIDNYAYSVGFAGNYGIPVWEMHLITPYLIQKPKVKIENSDWKTDSRVKGYRLTPRDFEGTDLEVVQLFPKEHAGDSAENRESSFLTSNLLFMNKQIKESIWDKITNSFQIIAARMRLVYLYAGPVFDKNPLKTKYIMNNKVGTPLYFYRIALYFEDEKACCKCYRIPNRHLTDYERTCNIDEYEYNIFQLEADTGIDFFSDDIDAQLKK